MCIPFASYHRARKFLWNMRLRMAAAVLSLGCPLLWQPAIEARPEPNVPSSPVAFLAEFALPIEGQLQPYSGDEKAPFPGFSMSRDLIAQGEGQVSGPRLSGEFRWSLLAKQSAKHGVAQIHLTGWLDTNDGAEIQLFASGTAKGPANRITPATALSMNGRFEVEFEPNYDWLDGLALQIEGHFDPNDTSFNLRSLIKHPPNSE